MKALAYVEIDVERCSLSYGVGACPAVLGVDSAQKCHNTLGTCPVLASFDDEGVTLRFAQVGQDYRPASIEARPCLTGVSYSPAVVSLGEGLGERAKLTLTFKDHRDSDTGPGGDPYLSERDYNPFTQGSYFGKFRARRPYLEGRELRFYRGFVGQELEGMEIQHFVIDSFTGPTLDGTFTIVAKDHLSLTQGDQAQVPALSLGFLLNPIDDNDLSATLTPAGIGNANYAASGYIALGGKEVVSFTRAADVLTIVRAQFGTTAQAHAAGDRAQECVHYDADDAGVIVGNILERSGVDPAYIPYDDWLVETTLYLQQVYTALIAEPTPAEDLLEELCVQAGLALWWDEYTPLMRLRVLRDIPSTAAVFEPASRLKNSFQVAEQPDKRISQVWIYFAKRNPLEKQEDADNYRSAVVAVAENEPLYGAPAIRKMYSRWIAQGGRSIATRVANIQLARYQDAPRKFNLATFRDGVTQLPSLGAGYQLRAWPLQDAFGAEESVPMQITRLSREAANCIIEAEEIRYVPFEDPLASGIRAITIDSPSFNLNMRELHDDLYPELTAEDVGSPMTQVILYVETGVIVGSESITEFAFDVGDWGAFVPDLRIVLRGRIQGAGGRGGGLYPKQAGGPAFYTREAVTIEYAGGGIWGGGSGGISIDDGGIWGGGGGAGFLPGDGGIGYSGKGGSPGTPTAGGSGPGPAGDGGDPGEVGQGGLAAGDAIDGISYVTNVGTPDVLGDQIN